MTTLYLVCLLVGGFFVLLSLVGGGDTDADADLAVDADFDADADFAGDAEVVTDVSGSSLVDLLSIRALFLFAAFFGLTGVLLSLVDTGEPFTIILSALVGILVGLGGNYLIQRVGYEHVSSDVTVSDLKGLTGKVLVPFTGDRRGKISLVSRGQRLQLIARAFENQTIDSFNPGDDVVVIRVDGSVAEVVKPE